ncbi:MAG: glycoside hydrolase [Thalassobius sp.]|nr:glycoside hydrolase [Thalassovita sp.]
MKRYLIVLIIAITHQVFAQTQKVEFDMPEMVLPKIPDYTVSITDFDAVPDGVTLNSAAFSKAIDALSAKGGGHLNVPSGIWLTGPITLKSNIDLHLESGALIYFSGDKDLYPIVGTSYEGLDTYRCISPINANGVENISITGSGIINGNGEKWRAVKKDKLTEHQWKELIASGGVLDNDNRQWFPSESYKKGHYYFKSVAEVANVKDPKDLTPYKDFLRPVMVSIRNSKNILLDGPIFQNSPAWNIHPLVCENIVIRNLTVRNPWYAQNGDGLDLESCKNAWVENNSFDVGDDAICIKSGKDEDGRKRGVPTENVIVRNNVVYHGHGGFVVGSEMSGGVKNMHVSNCTFIGTDVGLRFKSTRGRGGVVENIYISDIDMINIPTEPIRFNLFYGGKAPKLVNGTYAADNAEPVPVTEETPSFKEIYIKNVRAINAGSAFYFQGLPEMNIKGVYLENVYLQAKKGAVMIDTDNINFKNVKIEVDNDDALTIYNGKNIKIDNFSSDTKEGNSVRIIGSKTTNVNISDSETPKDVVVGKEVKSGSYIIN